MASHAISNRDGTVPAVIRRPVPTFGYQVLDLRPPPAEQLGVFWVQATPTYGFACWRCPCGRHGRTWTITGARLRFWWHRIAIEVCSNAWDDIAAGRKHAVRTFERLSPDARFTLAELRFDLEDSNEDLSLRPDAWQRRWTAGLAELADRGLVEFTGLDATLTQAGRAVTDALDEYR